MSRKFIPTNTLTGCINTLSPQDRTKYYVLTATQVILGILDFIGILLIGVLGTISFIAIDKGEKSDSLNALFSFLKISNLSSQSQAAFIGSLALFLMLFKTCLSVFLTRKTLYFLSSRAAITSSEVMGALLKQDLMTIRERSSQQILFLVTRGVDVINMQVIATISLMVSDLFLFLILMVGLFIVDTLTAVITIVLFCIIGLTLYLYMKNTARRLGVENALLSVKSNEIILESLESFREILVKKRFDYYRKEIRDIREGIAKSSTELNFMPYVSKYVMEASVLVGAGIIAFVQYLVNDIVGAFSTLAIFLAAGTRIAPAVLRLQQGALQIKSNIGIAQMTVEVINETRAYFEDKINIEPWSGTHEGFIPQVSCRNISFSYPGMSELALENVTMQIEPGSFVAIVGPSGAGKTTLIDLLLGVLKPSRGDIEISGMRPFEANNLWPGAMAYVPQNTRIIDGTIRENIGMGFYPSEAIDEQIEKCLRSSYLWEHVTSMPMSIDSSVGENGANLSGGQRQRLGLSRALFTNPLLLILDEATSSLDADTESLISNLLETLKGSVTVITVAHRLSSIRRADIIYYMSEGKIVASGSFADLRKQVPDFDRQVQLMSL